MPSIGSSGTVGADATSARSNVVAPPAARNPAIASSMSVTISRTSSCR